MIGTGSTSLAYRLAVISCVTGLLVVALSGCAVRRVEVTGEVLPFSAEARARLGRIGVVPGSVTNVSLVKPMDRTASTIAGMGAGVVAPFQIPGGPPHDPLSFMILLSFSAVGAPVGGTIGYFQGLPAGQIKVGEQQLRAAIAELHVEDLLCGRVLQNLSNSPYSAVLVGATNATATMAEQGIDTVLEARISTIGLKGESAKKAPLRAWITSHTRLVRAADGVELFARSFTHESGELTFSEWSANGGQAFRRELDAGATMLAHDIVRGIFADQGSVRRIDR